MIVTKFEVKFKVRLGEGDGDDKSVRVLNRVMEWRDHEGVRYEADQRHADIIVRELGLEEGSKAVKTPGVKEGSGEHAAFSETVFRALVARANYLAQGRGDIQFAVKELCRDRVKTGQP